MGKTKLAMIITAVVLGIVYFGLFPSANAGWGYASPHRGPSFFYMGYWGGPRYYSSGPSVRSGSTGGPAHKGRGPSAGK